MKENRNAIYVTAILTVASLLISMVINYNDKLSALFLDPEFVVNTLLGIFSGSILALIIAIINYSAMKRRELVEFANFINCLNIRVFPVFYLYKGGKRNLDHEINIILCIYDILLENLHMKPITTYFVFPYSRIEKKIDEIVEIISVLYKRVLNIKLLIDQYRFERIDIDELDSEIQYLFDFLRNYEGDELFVNVLDKLHREVLSLAHLDYSHSGEVKL